MNGGNRPTAVIEVRADRCQDKPSAHYYRRDTSGVWRCTGCPSTRVLMRYGIPTTGYPRVESPIRVDGPSEATRWPSGQ